MKNKSPEVILGITREDGKRDIVAFYGKKIASASNKKDKKEEKEKEHKKKGEWTNVQVFERDLPEGGFVVGIAHVTKHIGKPHHLTADYVNTKEEMIELVARLAPELADEIIIQIDEHDRTNKQRKDNRVMFES